VKVELDNLTEGQLARLLGVSTRQVRNLADAGIVKKQGQYNTARYAGPASIKAYLEHKIAQATPSSAKEASKNINEADLRVKNADAELKELKAAQLKGELVEVAYVEQSLGQLFGNLRSRILGLSSKLTPQLVGLATPAKVKALLDKEAKQTCEELVKIAQKTPRVKVEDDE
jgi:phage terminase Nu1 subunit (DNA packaging protein)